MAFQVTTTKDSIVTSVRAAMKAINPQAKSEEFQEVLAAAVAASIKSTLGVIQSTGVGAGPILTTPAGPVTGKGLAVNPKTMADIAEQIVLATAGGSGGIALKPYMTALFLPISLSLASGVEVVPTTGLGGAIFPPTGALPNVIEAFLLKELPQETVQQMITTPNGLAFIKGIAAGLSIGISSGVPSPVPFGGPSTAGVIIATYR